eukprot:12460488-Alexandrium_andersonii.AAC.1
MPGDPWGDLVFGFLQARVSKAIRKRLREQGLLFSLEVKGGLIPPSAWSPHHRDGGARGFLRR